MSNLLTLEEAGRYASEITGKTILPSNINYLVQYGRIDKFVENNVTYINKSQLDKYYNSNKSKLEEAWKDKLGNNVNWDLSFNTYSEAQTTKHVHRLHPYKGKFIPQLVEYFLDDHTDTFKKEVYFKKGDIVLDPFCGSGTTLVQANELGMHSIGVDISIFNAMISNCKIDKYDVTKLKEKIQIITSLLENYEKALNVNPFEEELLQALYEFNSKYFPSPEYKKAVYTKAINEKEYSLEKEKLFLPVFYEIASKYNVDLNVSEESFIQKWYFDTVRKEIYFVNSIISLIDDFSLKRILQVILSRTIRSCRATTHSDLATLKEPIYTTYYCSKHKKICKPLFSILKWWKTYSKDTVNRILEFGKIRTDTTQFCLTGDSASIDLEKEISLIGGQIEDVYKNERISGIFCSPPYIGLIDYHEQHAYAYELFGFERKDSLEIGSLTKGKNNTAIKAYVNEISSVLKHCKQYLKSDYNVFIVANDKYNVFPDIADKAGMEIVEKFERPVLNRTEKDRSAFSEIIFRMKDKKDE